jgi:ABC-type multidrug transport system permease subunit
MQVNDIFFIEGILLVVVYLVTSWKEKKFNLSKWSNDDIDIGAVAFLICNGLFLVYLTTQVK